MKAVLIIAPKGYQEYEYGETKAVLERAGIEVITAAKTAGLCHSRGGSTTTATLALNQVQVKDFQAIIFIGGSGSVSYQHDAQAQALAQEAIKQDKILAAICIAPLILAAAGVLKHKKATVWDSGGQQQAILTNAGAFYTGETVTVDENIVTANGPQATTKFVEQIVKLLKN